MEFMKISRKIAELNRERFSAWAPPFSPENAKPAVLAFSGDVYDGLSASTLKTKGHEFAQHHLRILSGLYGLLRPMDLIQPYRLEMGKALKTEDADNLYDFWTDTITDELNRLPGRCLINLASNEYFKAINPASLNKQVISPVFKDEKNGTFKIISFYAKKARGLMTRYIIENRIKNEQGLTSFSAAGYRYNAEFSKPDAPAFTRS